MAYLFQPANESQIPRIWEILQDAIARRKKDGSKQWQDGYPNVAVIESDLKKGVGFVLMEGSEVIAYTAVLINDEPEYERIQGKWLTNDDFVVFHRVAIAEAYAGKGISHHLMKCIEEYALKNKIYSIKADTNFDNPAMLRIFERAGYTYCGEVFFRGSARKAFEKVLTE